MTPTPDEVAALIKRLREKDAAITGTLLACLQNPEFAALVVGLKAASQEARAILESLIYAIRAEAAECRAQFGTPIQQPRSLTRDLTNRERAVLAPPHPRHFGIPSQHWEAAQSYAKFWAENNKIVLSKRCTQREGWAIAKSELVEIKRLLEEPLIDIKEIMEFGPGFNSTVRNGLMQDIYTRVCLLLSAAPKEEEKTDD